MADWIMLTYDDSGTLTGTLIAVGGANRIRSVVDRDDLLCTIQVESGEIYLVTKQRIYELNRWIREEKANPQDYYTLEGASDD